MNNDIQNRPTKPQPRLPGLDYLRFGAALMVVAYHFLHRGYLNNEFLQNDPGLSNIAVEFGYFGVQLFFMISGFVIIWSAENKDWISFSVARFIRLWPAYFAAVGLTGLATWAYGAAPFDTSIMHWLANLTFFAPAFGYSFMDGVYWTIVLELIFYFWIAVAMFTRLLPKHLLGLCMVWMYVIIFNEFWLQSKALEVGLITRHGPWFIMGLLTYQTWKKQSSWLTLVLFVTAASLSFVAAIAERVKLAANFDLNLMLQETLVANLAMIFIFALFVRFGHKFKASSIAMTLGAMTYPLYLVHQHVGYMIINLTVETLSPIGAIGLATVTTSLLAWMIYAYWEQPVGRILKPRSAALVKFVLQKLSFTASQTA